MIVDQSSIDSKKSYDTTNVLFTTLSVKPKSFSTPNYYFCEGTDGKRLWCKGIQQQEPDAKYILTYHRIDKIVISGSDATIDVDVDELAQINGKLLREWLTDHSIVKDEYEKFSTVKIFLIGLADFLYGKRDKNEIEEKYRNFGLNPEEALWMSPVKENVNQKHDIQVEFVPDQINGYDNLIGLTDALRCVNDENAKEKINLYMDMQGGLRTSIYINNALLQLLSKQNTVYDVTLKSVVANSFKPGGKPFEDGTGRIFDETDRYKIVDLVSGMNAFIKYGKSDLIADYLVSIDTGKCDEIQNLIKAMQAIDNAIMLSRIREEGDKNSSGQDLMSAIKELKKAIEDMEKTPVGTGNRLGNIFKVLIAGIKADYGGLLEGEEIDVIELVNWLVRKDNLITAIAVLESLLPAYLVNNGMLYYARNDDDKGRAEIQFKFYYYRSEKRDRYKLNDVNHYFIKYYLKDLGINLIDKKNKTQIINDLLNNKALPIKIYSDVPDEIGDILAQYDFLSQQRNKLLHVSPNKNTQPNREELKDNFVNLIKRVITAKTKKKNDYSEYVSEDDYIKNEKRSGEQNSIYVRTIKNELGILDDLEGFNFAKKQKYAYALGPILPQIGKLVEKWNTLKAKDSNAVNEKREYLNDKKNEFIVSVLIDSYNSCDSASEQVSYAQLMKLNFINQPVNEITEKMVVDRIKRKIKHLDDFHDMFEKNLQSMEKWEGFCQSIKDELAKNCVDEDVEKNQELLNGVFAILGDGDAPNWQEPIAAYIERHKSDIADNWPKN